MTDGSQKRSSAKGCPYMIRENGTMIPCEGNNCMAWVPAVYHCLIHRECSECDGESCELETCNKAVKAVLREGFCRLIEGEVRP